MCVSGTAGGLCGIRDDDGVSRGVERDCRNTSGMAERLCRWEWLPFEAPHEKVFEAYRERC